MSRMTIQRCGVCATEFPAKLAVVLEGGARYCSVQCGGASRTQRAQAGLLASIERRFYEHIVIPGPVLVRALGPCHTWDGADDGHGYGQLRIAGRTERAHRVAFFLHHGRWPEPNCLHHCDGGAIGCARWEHLYEGSAADNTGDMLRRGRNKTTLTADDVRTIRAELAAGARQNVLARRFGVGNSQVNRIATGTSWGRLE
jgi:hypothetical protein